MAPKTLFLAVLLALLLLGGAVVGWKQDAALAQHVEQQGSSRYSAAGDASTGGGYRLEDLGFSTSGDALQTPIMTGGDYRLAGVGSPEVNGGGCCCLYLPCVQK